MRRSLVVVVLISLILVVTGVPAGAVTQRERTTRDELQNILRGLDDLRRFVIDGDAYTAFFEATSLASGDSTVVQLTTGDTDIFFFQTAFTSNAANVEIRFHESPSIAGGETVEIPTFNLNRQATDTSSLTLFSDATGVTGGDTIVRQELYGGSSGINILGALDDKGAGLILKKNTQYARVIRNDGSGNVDVFVRWFWVKRDTSLLE